MRPQFCRMKPLISAYSVFCDRDEDDGRMDAVSSAIAGLIASFVAIRTRRLSIQLAPLNLSRNLE